MDLVARGLPSPPPPPLPPTIKAALSSSLTTSMKTSVTELSTWGSTRYPLIWRLHTICNLIGLFFHLNWEKDSQMRYIMQRWVGGAATVLYLHFIQNFYNLSKPVWIELSGVWKLATMHILLYPSDFTLRGSVLFQVLDLRGGTTRLHVCGNPNGMRHKSISLTCQTFVGQVMQHICQSSTLLQMVLVKSQSIKFLL